MPRRHHLPSCYYPTTVLLVSDDRNFLMSYCLHLEENCLYQLSDAPLDSLNAIKKNNPSHLLNRCYMQNDAPDGSPLTTETFSLDLSAIHWELYNEKRFEDVSVVLVDNTMKTIEPLTYCSELIKRHIKCILLIEAEEEPTAIKYFTEGKIDAYWIKSRDAYVELNTMIRQHQRNFFLDMSSVITRTLALNSASCLVDQAFIQLFNRICCEHKIKEAYLIDTTGSFVLADAEGSLTYLVIKNEQDMQSCYELAKDGGADEQTLHALRGRKCFPCSISHNDSQKTIFSQWGQELVPADTLAGDKVYYYTLLKNVGLYGIQKEKITSYQKYLETEEIT